MTVPVVAKPERSLNVGGLLSEPATRSRVGSVVRSVHRGRAARNDSTSSPAHYQPFAVAIGRRNLRARPVSLGPRR